jgi:hypothetical protein
MGMQSMGMMMSDTRRKRALGSVSRGGRFRGLK